MTGLNVPVTGWVDSPVRPKCDADPQVVITVLGPTEQPVALTEARQAARYRHPATGIARGDHRSRLSFELDPNLPVLLFRIGHYPLHHGTVGAIRSLGRAGVPVFAVTEDRFTPAATSRYLTRRIEFPSSGSEPQATLLERLIDVGRQMGTKPLLMCTDDEAAVLVGEGGAVLREHFVLPDVPPDLPRQLASKRGLHELCQLHGVVTPRTRFPNTWDELRSAVAELQFPVVVKNSDPWLRLTRPAVSGSTMVRAWSALDEVARDWREPFCGLVQEYLPDDSSEDWIVHGYWGSDAESTAVFTGRKLRSWPPHFGATAYARVESNDDLVGLTRRLCEQLGYRGIFDLDWRFDRRTGRYNLLDFNPRLGAQFRLFEDDAGVDVVRAMHLDLSGRALPPGRQRDGERFMVENLHLASRRGTASRGRSPRRCRRVGRAHVPRVRASPGSLQTICSQCWRSACVRSGCRC